MARSLGIFASATLLGLVACTSNAVNVGSHESSLDETSEPRQGASIDSPSVDASKSYWGARSIDLLSTVGYLTSEEASVARRADGIIASNPPNGRIGVDELAELDKRSATLFPAERAVLAKLWQILEIEPAPVVAPAAASIPQTVIDQYTVSPTWIPVDLSASPLVAQRVQLTQNDDGNPTTISGPDVEKAYADRDSYLPEEIVAMREIVRTIATNAGRDERLPLGAQRVEIPGNASTLLHDATSVKLWNDITPAMSAQWSSLQPGSPATVTVQSTVRVTVESEDTNVLLIDKTAGSDSMASSPASLGFHSTRIEVWKGGTRTAQFDADTAQPSEVTLALPFGYAVKIGDRLFNLEFTPDEYRTVTGAYVETPLRGWTIPSGAFYVAGQPSTRLDVFPNGRARFTSGTSTRDCFPDGVKGYGYAEDGETEQAYEPRITGCSVLDAAGETVASFMYSSHGPSDSPTIVDGWVGSDRVFLYPY